MQLVIENNKAYLLYSDIGSMKPQYVYSYWEIKNIDSSLLTENQCVYKIVNSWVTRISGREVPLVINDYPDIVKFIPIRPPRRTGYIWQWGEWVKKN